MNQKTAPKEPKEIHVPEIPVKKLEEVTELPISPITVAVEEPSPIKKSEPIHQILNDSPSPVKTKAKKDDKYKELMDFM